MLLRKPFFIDLITSGTTQLVPEINLVMETTHYQQIIAFLSALKKPRTYRKNVRKDYLNTAQNKKPGKAKIRKAVGKQLRYLNRNVKHIEVLLDLADQQRLDFPIPKDLQRYDQQLEVFDQKKNRIGHRIVSIHQPHVRPMVRGKAKSPTGFGAKMHLSMIEGYCFADTISWDVFHEATHLPEYVQDYKTRYGYYPEKGFVDNTPQDKIGSGSKRRVSKSRPSRWAGLR